MMIGNSIARSRKLTWHPRTDRGIRVQAGENLIEGAVLPFDGEAFLPTAWCRQNGDFWIRERGEEVALSGRGGEHSSGRLITSEEISAREFIIYAQARCGNGSTSTFSLYTRLTAQLSGKCIVIESETLDYIVLTPLETTEVRVKIETENNIELTLSPGRVSFLSPVTLSSSLQRNIVIAHTQSFPSSLQKWLEKNMETHARLASALKLRKVTQDEHLHLESSI